MISWNGAIKMSAQAHRLYQRKGPLSSFMVLAEFISVCAIGLRGHQFFAVGWRLPLVPCPMNLSNMAACFIKIWKPRRQKREPACQMGIAIVCNLAREVTPHHFCYTNNHMTFANAWQITRFSLLSWGGNYTRTWILGGRGHRGCLQKSA